MPGGTDVTSPRFTGQYYINGVLYQDGMQVMIVGGGMPVIGDGGSNAHLDVKRRANAVRKTGNSEVLITNAPCYVMGYVANKGASASTGYFQLRNASATGGASTPIMEPDGTGGVQSEWADLYFDTGLTWQGSAAGTDITIMWRPAQ